MSFISNLLILNISQSYIFTYKKYNVNDITVIKDVAREQTDSEEREYQKELKELEKLEKQDSEIKNSI